MSMSGRSMLVFMCVAFVPMFVGGVSTTEGEYASVLRTKPDWVNGQKAYETCAACHGPNGGGTSDGYIPIIAAQHYRYVARALIAYRHAERWDPRMEHFVDNHHLQNVQEISDVAYYVSRLEPVSTASNGDGVFVEHGAEVFDHQCRSCHGSSGNGNDDRRNPRLAGQHFGYLVRQLHDALEGRRPNFPLEHVKLLQGFEKADLDGVSDYLSRLPSRHLN
jgi:predicted CxxxxCH...CXXCH cytochrome family protein